MRSRGLLVVGIGVACAGSAQVEAQPAPRLFDATIAVVPASPFAGAEVCRTTPAAANCRARPFKRAANDLTDPRWGTVRPAVAKNVIAGYPAIHSPAYLDDGLYGNGASWVAASADAWVKIDLGQLTTVSEVRLGRDRTGGYDDRDPGNLVVMLATTDDVYANGNDANDATEYTPVFDYGKSKSFVPDWPEFFKFAGPQTFAITFAPRQARYVKVKVSTAGAALDEIEVLGTATELDACRANPCNGPGQSGVCTDLPGIVEGPAGRTCAIAAEVDACLANPCNGPGMNACTDLPGNVDGPAGRTCSCESGFTINAVGSCEDGRPDLLTVTDANFPTMTDATTLRFPVRTDITAIVLANTLAPAKVAVKLGTSTRCAVTPTASPPSIQCPLVVEAGEELTIILFNSAGEGSLTGGRFVRFNVRPPCEGDLARSAAGGCVCPSGLAPDDANQCGSTTETLLSFGDAGFPTVAANVITVARETPITSVVLGPDRPSAPIAVTVSDPTGVKCRGPLQADSPSPFAFPCPLTLEPGVRYAIGGAWPDRTRTWEKRDLRVTAPRLAYFKDVPPWMPMPTADGAAFQVREARAIDGVSFGSAPNGVSWDVMLRDRTAGVVVATVPAVSGRSRVPLTATLVPGHAYTLDATGGEPIGVPTTIPLEDVFFDDPHLLATGEPGYPSIDANGILTFAAATTIRGLRVTGRTQMATDWRVVDGATGLVLASGTAPQVPLAGGAFDVPLAFTFAAGKPYRVLVTPWTNLGRGADQASLQFRLP